MIAKIRESESRRSSAKPFAASPMMKVCLSSLGRSHLGIIRGNDMKVAAVKSPGGSGNLIIEELSLIHI